MEKGKKHYQDDRPSLSDYEKLRLSKIARNEAKLKSLGLWKNDNDASPFGNKQTRKKRKQTMTTENVSNTTRRRSSRLAQSPEIKQEEGVGVVTPNTVKKENGRGVEQEDDDAITTVTQIKKEMLDKMKYEIDELRRCQPPVGSMLIKEEEGTNGEEVNCMKISKKLWGDGCEPPPNCSWKTFLMSREASPSPNLPSPLGMYQELYAHDGWKTLICCALMSRVSSFDTKDRCIRGFFKLCPTPSHVANVNIEELSYVVNSLGFQYERVRAISEITRAWLTRGDFTIDSIDKSKGGNKIYMCGPFVIDSYYLFCKGRVDWKPTCKIRDVERFYKWLKKINT